MLITLMPGKKCFSMSTTIQKNCNCFAYLCSEQSRYLNNHLGVIALIDQVLYLVIHNKNANTWKCIKPMIDIYDYFLMPQCWRLNQHQHLLSNL